MEIARTAWRGHGGSNRIEEERFGLLPIHLTLGLFFYTEDGSSVFLLTISRIVSDYTVSLPRRQLTSQNYNPHTTA
jgi:hypothetical protein